MVSLSVVLICAARLTAALPIVERAPGADNPTGSQNQKTFIIAGVVVGITIVAVLIVLRFRVINKRNRAVQVPLTGQAILSAGPSTTNVTTSTTDATTPAPRQSRRPRRTPSQISTKSLPAYSNEPGEEELVLVRRANESEDYSRSSVDLVNPTTYDFRTSEDVHTPLMDQFSGAVDSEPDSPVNQFSQQRRGHQPSLSMDSVATGSADTHGSRGSNAELLVRGSPNVSAIDERGEAPAYDSRPPSGVAERSSITIPNEPHQESITGRIMPRSFRNLFGSRSRPTSQADPVPMVSLTEAPGTSSGARNRADTALTIPDAQSVPSLLLNRSQSPSNSRLNLPGSSLHRPLTNGSSNSSLVHGRSRSGSSLGETTGLGQQGNMSSTSINSALIGSPLAHTATRTEFRFPKSGPTAEQLKFLSSRESLGRFGVPFGDDAEAAAARDRSDLPPPFHAENTASSPSEPGPAVRSQPLGGNPIRNRPGSWWKNLTQSVSAPSSPSPGTAEAAVVEPTHSTTTTAETDAVPLAESFPRSLSPSHPNPDLTILPTSYALPLSRATSVSSARTGMTYATAVDTESGVMTSPSGRLPSDNSAASSDDDDNAFTDAPPTPLATRRSSISLSAPIIPAPVIDDSMSPTTPTGAVRPH